MPSTRMPAIPFAYPELLEEGLEPHTVPEMWIMATDRADRAVDVTEYFDLKLRRSVRTGARWVTVSISTRC